MTRITFISFIIVAVALTPLVYASPYQDQGTVTNIGGKPNSKHQLSFEEVFRVRDISRETTEPAEEVPTCGTLCIGKPEICMDCQCGAGPEIPCKCTAVAAGVALCRPSYWP